MAPVTGQSSNYFDVIYLLFAQSWKVFICSKINICHQTRVRPDRKRRKMIDLSTNVHHQTNIEISLLSVNNEYITVQKKNI